MSGKKVTLRLKDKIEVIQLSSKFNVKELCEKFNCGKTQIYDVLKNKDRIIEQWLEGEKNVNCRRQKKCKYEDIDEVLFKWFVQTRSKNLPISGPILQEQARQIAVKLGNNTFTASNGWLEKFRSRHSISYNKISGEANDVDMETVDDWKNKLNVITAGYELKNIGNCDETGLFFRALPNHTLNLKNEKCIGGKLSKHRLTVLVCGFADGRLEKPLVIGKSWKPRCFKNVVHLPLEWHANNKAWMTLDIMGKWLFNLNERMKCENRHILLFMDNASCHPRESYSNINLVFFPPNTTSVTQPMDQGVIKALKTYYRKRVLNSLIVNIEACSSVQELTSKITVLDALRWLSDSYKNIAPDCVKNAFKHAGFSTDVDTNMVTTEYDGTTTLTGVGTLLQESGYVSISAEEYVAIDNAVSTEEAFTSLDEIIQQQTNKGDESEEEPEHQCTVNEIKSFGEALKKIAELEEFAIKINSDELRQNMLSAKNIVECEGAKGKLLRQKKMFDFFKKN